MKGFSCTGVLEWVDGIGLDEVIKLKLVRVFVVCPSISMGG